MNKIHKSKVIDQIYNADRDDLQNRTHLFTYDYAIPMRTIADIAEVTGMDTSCIYDECVYAYDRHTSDEGFLCLSHKSIQILLEYFKKTGCYLIYHPSADSLSALRMKQYRSLCDEIPSFADEIDYEYFIHLTDSCDYTTEKFRSFFSLSNMDIKTNSKPVNS